MESKGEISKTNWHLIIHVLRYLILIVPWPAYFLGLYAVDLHAATYLGRGSMRIGFP